MDVNFGNCNIKWTSGEDTAAINCGKGYEGKGAARPLGPAGAPPGGRRPAGRSKIRLEKKEFQLY